MLHPPWPLFPFPLQASTAASSGDASLMMMDFDNRIYEEVRNNGNEAGKKGPKRKGV